MSEHYIEFNNVTKIYGSGTAQINALSDVSFTIDKGEFCVLLGSSGAGKTTLLNMLGGMDTITSGTIVFDGKDVSKLTKKELVEYRRHDVGFVFQFYNLIPNLTALENVEIAAQLCKDPIPAKEALSMVGLAERENNFPAQLSGGPAGAAFSDGAQGALPRDAGTPRTSPATSAGDILRAALSSLADPESLAAFDAAIGAAAEAAFAGLDPASPTLAEDFRGRLPALMDALPQVFAATDPAEAAEAIQDAMLAAFLNGALPPDFWRRRPAPDGTPGTGQGSSPTGRKSSTPGTTTGSSSPRRSTRR